jgi:nitrite reductase/ring-hydroxylating ferredoxin subunit
MLSKGQRVAVFNVDGKFYALDDACPHEGAPLSLGRLDRHILTCRVHEWEFDVTTGECLTCPSKPVKTYCVAKELTRLRIRPRKALRRT